MALPFFQVSPPLPHPPPTPRRTHRITCYSLPFQHIAPILHDSETLPVPHISVGRRELALSFTLLCFSASCATSAGADTGAGTFSKYIKRKKLDPLDTYIPPVLLSQSQFQDLGVKLLSDKPDYGDSRSYLRSGPASSLRTNIRAVAQYASDAGTGKSAYEAVDECIRSLEDLDLLLLQASRNESSASPDKMKAKIDTALDALNRLLSTVPPPILEKCREIVASYEESSSSSSSPSSQQVDPDVKLLESLL